MVRVVITGGIACGKSLFCEFLQQHGILTLDSDEISHQLVEANGEALPELVKEFGSGILDKNGGLNRPLFAKTVFTDFSARQRVNSILHPMIRQKINTWLAEQKDHLTAVAIPLLFEIGWERDWDVIICLASSEQKQIDRMVSSRGYTEEEARARIASQMPLSEKMKRADIVVWNETDVSALSSEAERIFEYLSKRSNEDFAR